MYSFLKAFLVLMKLLSLSQFYATNKRNTKKNVSSEINIKTHGKMQ